MRSFLIVLFVATACDDKSVGDGIGRDRGYDFPAPDLQPITIRGAAIAVAPAERFVEIEPAAGADLTGLALCGHDAEVGCVPLPASVSGRLSVCLGDLDLNPSAGDLAIVDRSTGIVHAYIAWGADPSIIGGDWASGAYYTGLAAAGRFARLSYPMPDGVGFVEGGCAPVAGGATCDASTLGAADDTLCDGPATADLELVADSGADTATVVNNGTAELDLFGVRVCQARSCTSIPRGTRIQGGQTVIVDLEAPIEPEIEVSLVAPGGLDPACTAATCLFRTVPR